jgi:hypothetical protein
VSGYIYIPNWEKFQHYKDKSSPAWIKCYRRLLSDDAYLALSLADRGLLLNLWLLCSDAGEGRVSADRRLLARRLNVRRVSLDALIQAGFIQVRSRKRLDKVYKASRAETEAETEKREITADARAHHNGEATVLPLNGERIQALDALLDAIGSDGDENTPATIHRLVAARNLSTADLQLARERICEVRTDNKAKYAVGILKNVQTRSTA